MVTDWIASVLPHSIFGVLTVTQAQLDAVGATLPRAAYIHFIVEQILVGSLYILWPLLHARRCWRLMPYYEIYLRRAFVNLDEHYASIGWKPKMCIIFYCIAIPVLAFYMVGSPAGFLILIERDHTGSTSYRSTGAAWAGVNSLVFVGVVIALLRLLITILLGKSAHPKD